MNLVITDPDHPHFGKTARLVPLDRSEPEVIRVELADGTRTTVIGGQIRVEWSDASE